jgi:hypothetical protein
MSIQNLNIQSLITLTQSLGFESVKWEERPGQLVTANYKGSNEGEAERIANAIANVLNLKADVVNVVKSSQGGNRAIIWNIPRFAAALNEYDEKKISASLEQMQASVKATSKITQDELNRAEKLLNDFCERKWWSVEDMNFATILKSKINFLDSSREVTIQPQEREGYLIKTKPTYICFFDVPEELNYREMQMSISDDDIRFILKLFENKNF